MPEETALVPVNDNPEPDFYDKLTIEELFKAVLDSHNGGKTEYSGLLADPMESSLYRIGQNYQKWTPTEEQLFSIVESSPLLTLIHVHRQTQITRLDGWQDAQDKLGWAIVHKSHDKRKENAPDDAEGKIEYLRGIFEEPYHLAVLGNTFTSLMNQCVDFGLTVDKVPIELLRKGKRLKSLVLYDPRTIRPVWELIWQYKRENADTEMAIENPKYILEKLSEQYAKVTGGADLTKCSWVQYYQNQLKAAWTDDEMIVGMNFPSARMDRRGFGLSRAERAVLALEAWINAWGYNAEQFKIGISMAKGILAAIGSYSDENVKSLKKSLIGQLTKRPGTTFPIISVPSKDGLQWIRLDPNNKEMDFMQWLDYCSSMVCGIYSVDPQEIGLASRAQAFSGKLISNTSAEALTAKKDHGYQSLLLELKHLNDRIIKRAGPEFVDYRFIWTGIDKVATEQERIQILKSKDFLTINEKRIQENEDQVEIVVPLLGTEINFADVPDRLLDPLLRAIQQAQQAKMQDSMMQQQQQAGAEPDQGGGDQGGEVGQEEAQQEPAPGETGEAEPEKENVGKAILSGMPKLIRLNITRA